MSKNLKYILLIVVLSYIFFIFGNGVLSLTNPDEVFYSQTAKEMIQHNSWMTQYLFNQLQFEKPIFTYWLLRIAFSTLGLNAFAARFFPALFALFGIIATYLLGVLVFNNKKKAFISSLILMSCGIYVGLARTVFTDMIFTVLILFALLSFYWAYSRRDKKSLGILLFFVFAGLAVLTKGPLGILIPLGPVVLFLLIKRELKFIFCAASFWGLLAFILISLPWYVLMYQKYGNSFTQEFFYNDHFRRLIVAEHKPNDSWYFYPFSIVVGMFPWVVYTILSLVYLGKKLIGKPDSAYMFLACWIGAVLLAFQFAHSKLVSYIMPLFPAVSLVVGDFIYDAIEQNKWRRLFTLSSFATLFIILAMPIGLFVAMAKFPEYIPSKAPIYIMAGILITIIIANLIFILRRKPWQNIYLTSCLLPIILFWALSMSKCIESYVSSRNACAYLMNNYEVKGTILCSKFLVRGVRFYTDREVAVVNIRGEKFFSPHPIPFLDTDQKVSEFLQGQALTYCVLNKGSVQDIERIVGTDFKATVLNVLGDEYILRIERLKNNG